MDLSGGLDSHHVIGLVAALVALLVVLANVLLHVCEHILFGSEEETEPR